MKKAIFMLGIEFGYPRGELEVEVLAEGINGMSVVRLPPGCVANFATAVLMADGSLAMPVCQDFLRPVQPPVHANLLKSWG